MSVLLYKKIKKGFKNWFSSSDNQWSIAVWLVRGISWCLGLGEVPLLSIQLIRMLLLYYQKRSI